MSVLKDYCTLRRSSRSCLFDQNPRNRLFTPRFVEPERSQDMPRCVDYNAVYYIRLYAACSYSFLLIVTDAEIDSIVVNEWARREGSSSVKASFIYIMQSASRSHRRRDDLAACSRRRVFCSTASITFTSIQ